MKSELNILILPVRMIDEDDACALNEIFTSYPDHEITAFHRYMRCSMLELILATAWGACPSMPHGQPMDLDRMMSRPRLYSINGRPC